MVQHVLGHKPTKIKADCDQYGFVCILVNLELGYSVFSSNNIDTIKYISEGHGSFISLLKSCLKLECKSILDIAMLYSCTN
jgi:hypothetical protein